MREPTAAKTPWTELTRRVDDAEGTESAEKKEPRRRRGRRVFSQRKGGGIKPLGLMTRRTTQRSSEWPWVAILGSAVRVITPM